ncbi:hypothetical protein OSTOST_14806 [Ostertagia ostertagi]
MPKTSGLSRLQFNAMKTVKLKRAAILASGAVIFILLCVITSLPASENQRPARAIRPGRLLPIRPLTKAAHTQAIFGGASMPATIVDAADTLWIMDLKEEYKEVLN